MRRFVTILLLICASLQARPELLVPGDVHLVMDQLLGYHVDKQRMTPELLGRSLQVYIDQFDPERIYLTEDEIRPFAQPSSRMVHQLAVDYRKEKFDIYAALHRQIQTSIKRAQDWREEFATRSALLVAESKKFRFGEDWTERGFADSEQELKRRQKDHIRRLAAAQREQLGDRALLGKEAKVLKLYTRNRMSHENGYLFNDEEQGKLSRAEQRDGFLTHVLKAMAKSLDSHTSFFSYTEAYDMRVRLEKAFKGVGIVLQESIDGVTVTRLIDGGPAAKSGRITEKDRIVGVDGRSIVDFSFDKVLELVRGEEGSPIVLRMKRDLGDREAEFDVTLYRAAVVIQEDRVDWSIEEHSEHTGGKIGVITLHSFYEGAGGVSAVRDVRNAIRELEKAGPIDGLVLDLRENTGGFLMQAVKVAGLFITNGVVVVSKYSDGGMRYFRDIDGHAYYDGPMVVLISRASASAAEIVAQALQDYGVAIVVGDEHSYGKGSIQHQTVTDPNSRWFFKVTVGRYYTASGQSTQIKGVKSDILVPGLLNGEKIGEAYTDYPLESDSIDPAFQDQLSDLDQHARQWYQRHYLPSLQKLKRRWRSMVSTLKQMSQARIQRNPGYQRFLASLLNSDELPPGDRFRLDEESDKPDYQLEEAVEIVEDMINLESRVVNLLD